MKLKAFILIALMVTGSFSVYGQMMNQGQNQQQPGQQNNQQNYNMMQLGYMPGWMYSMMDQMGYYMHGSMYNQTMPMERYMMTLYMLPNMQSQLSLTPEQSEKLVDMQADFRKQQADHQAAIAKYRMKLQGLLEKNATSDQVREQLENLSKTRNDIKIAAYEMAGKMRNVLNSDQQQQWEDMMDQQQNYMFQNMQNSGFMRGGHMMNNNMNNSRMNNNSMNR